MTLKGSLMCNPKNMPLRHKNYFELIIFKKEQAQEKLKT